MSSSAAQDKKKKNDPKKPQAKDKKKELQEKKGAGIAGGAAKIVDKAMSKGYADQKAALKPKDKQAAQALGPKTDDQKKVGVAEAAQKAGEDRKGGEAKQDHPLNDAKKQLQKAEKAAEKKAAEAADPKKKSREKTPPVPSKLDKDKAKKDRSEAGIAAVGLEDEQDEKQAEGEDHEAAMVAAVAKDKAHGKQDPKHAQQLKGKQGKKDDKEGHQEGHGSPEEMLAAEMIKAAKEKEEAKKGERKKAGPDMDADVIQKKKWWSNSGGDPEAGAAV